MCEIVLNTLDGDNTQPKLKCTPITNIPLLPVGRKSGMALKKTPLENSTVYSVPRLKPI